MPLIGGRSKSSSKGTTSRNSTELSSSEHLAVAELGDILKLKDPMQWTISEVSAWLETLELSELIEAFRQNSIGGSELMDLSQDDMKLLGVNKLGHRKKLLRKIGTLRGDLTTSDSSSQISGSSQAAIASSSIADSSENSETPRKSNKMRAKCKFEGHWYTLPITSSTTFKSLRRQLEEQFGTKLRVKYMDADGDQLSIKREADLVEAVAEMQQAGFSRIKLYLSRRDSTSHTSDTSTGQSEMDKSNGGSSTSKKHHHSKQSAGVAPMDMFTMFDLLLDPVIVISERGIIQFVNKKVESVFGYGLMELTGKNVNVLMTEDQRPYHDTYMAAYLKTGVSRIIGKGRDVIAVKKDGSIIPVHLEVTEKTMGSGHLYFIGILKEAKVQAQEKSLIQQEREVLYSLLVPALIVDGSGSIHGFNKAASDLLGFTLVDIISKPMATVLPSCEEEFKAYLSGTPSELIGTGKNIVAQHKDGRLIPAFLSFTEKRDNDKRFFTGIIQEVHQLVAVASKR